MWAVSTVTMLVLAGILPDFQLQSPDGDSATRIAVTAAFGAGAFGLLSALAWPLLVRLLLLVPALVLGLLVFFLNGSLLLIALRLNPAGDARGRPRDRRRRGRRDVRRRLRDRRRPRRARRRRLPAPPLPPRRPPPQTRRPPGPGHARARSSSNSTASATTYCVRRVGEGLMPTVAGWLAGDGAAHRLTPWRTDWSSQTGASQLGILHGSNHDVPAFRWYEKDSRRGDGLQPADQRRRTPAPRRRAHR